jgi:diguanylate cyclase (GGDEF)-like protein
VGKSVYEVFSQLSISLNFNGWTDSNLDPDDEQFRYTVLQVSPLQDLKGNQLGRITILRDLIFSSQNDSLKSQNAILTALQETTIDLHSSLDLDVVLHNIVARACTLLGTVHGYVDIIGESGELEPMIGIGSLEESLKYKISKGEGIAGVVWETRKPLVVNDYDKWSGRVSSFVRGAIRAAVGMPLLLDDQVVGVIGVAHEADNDAVFTEDDVSVLQRFADLAVIALKNARAYEKAQNEIEFRRETEIELRNTNQVLQLQIERIELLQDELQELAIRDPLTKLYNRRYLAEMLEIELSHPERSKNSLAVLMIDSDHLKSINDEHGHKAGDDFLIQIADVIRDNIRAGDVACRYGGDEYVVIMNNVTPVNAYTRAEDLRKGVAGKSLIFRNEKVNISISIGIAMYPAHGCSGDELLQLADQALYEAKRLGKNCVAVFNGDENE